MVQGRSAPCWQQTPCSAWHHRHGGFQGNVRRRCRCCRAAATPPARSDRREESKSTHRSGTLDAPVLMTAISIGAQSTMHTSCVLAPCARDCARTAHCNTNATLWPRQKRTGSPKQAREHGGERTCDAVPSGTGLLPGPPRSATSVKATGRTARLTYTLAATADSTVEGQQVIEAHFAAGRPLQGKRSRHARQLGATVCALQRVHITQTVGGHTSSG